MRSALLATTLVAAANPTLEAAATARPARSEESAPVPVGVLRVSAGYEEAGGKEDLEIRAGTAAVATGLAPRTDLTVEGVYLRIHAPPAPSVSGWGDPTVAMRSRILEERGRRPALDYTLGVKLPSGDHTRNLGTEETDVYTHLHAEHAWARAQIHLNAGFTIVGLTARPHEQADSFLYGVAIDAPLGRHTVLLLDLFAEHLVNVRRNPFAYFEDYGHAVITGLRVDRAGVTWDAALFHPLDGPAGIWGVTCGMSRRLP